MRGKLPKAQLFVSPASFLLVLGEPRLDTWLSTVGALGIVNIGLNVLGLIKQLQQCHQLLRS